MKKTILFTASLALLAIGVVSCGGSTEEAAAEKVTYNLDAEATKLMWKGDYADGTHSHNGTVKVADGSAVFNGEEFESATFNVDLGTIESELTPETGANDLLGHFSSPDFFNTAKFPKAKVTVNSWDKSEMDVTINVAGKDLKAKFPVKSTTKGETMTTTGKFDVDFSSLDLAGFKPNAEKEAKTGKKDQYTKPVVHFELNLVLKAEAAKE